ncbi:MAG: phosphotyrosine protein phosphatase [Actinomycetota bacterium]
MSDRHKILFVCSRNQWRSPTAERIYAREPGLAVRSGGTSPKARCRVSEADVRWADAIFVMERKHRDRLAATFPRAMQYKVVHVLGIPDEYQFMDPELIELLEQVVTPLLGNRH